MKADFQHMSKVWGSLSKRFIDGSTSPQPALQSGDSQAIEYFICTWWIRFLHELYQKDQLISACARFLALPWDLLCETLHLSAFQLYFPKWDIDFSFPLYFVSPAQISLDFDNVLYKYQQSVVPWSVSTSKKKHNKIPIIPMKGFFLPS